MSARLQERTASLTIRRLEIIVRVKVGDHIVERTERSVITKQNYDQTFAQASSGEEKSALKFLITLYRGNFYNLFVSFFFLIIKSSPLYVLPIVTSNIINIASSPGQHATRDLWINFAVISVIILQNIPTHTWYISFMSKAIRHVEAGIRSSLVRKLQQLSITYHRDLQAGRLQAKVIRDVEAVEQLSKQLMLSLLPAIINIIVSIVLTAMNSWTVSSFFVITIPASIALVTIFRKKIRKTNKEFRKQVEQMSSIMSEMVEMIPVTRAHGLENVEIERMDDSLRNFREKVSGSISLKPILELQLGNLSIFPSSMLNVYGFSRFSREDSCRQYRHVSRLFRDDPRLDLWPHYCVSEYGKRV